jgi:hypothetical protein
LSSLCKDNKSLVHKRLHKTTAVGVTNPNRRRQRRKTKSLKYSYNYIMHRCLDNQILWTLLKAKMLYSRYQALATTHNDLCFQPHGNPTEDGGREQRMDKAFQISLRQRIQSISEARSLRKEALRIFSGNLGRIRSYRRRGARVQQ